MSAPEVMTFGCRLNAFESEVMKNHAEAAGMKNALIVNTCAVTGEAVRQARQAIRRAHRENPDKEIIVTGCAAQIDPLEFSDIPGVTKVIGNDEKMKPETYLSLKNKEKVLVNDIMSVKETAGHLIEGFEGKSRAFVQVQNGCDHRCTFCIIPYGRGNSRSVGIGEVVNQIKVLVDKGYKEVVLTGVDITSFGADLPGTPELGDLVQKILVQVPDLPRLRLSSLDAVEVDDALFEAITGDERLMPHLHLSLQAGDNMILKRMKRRHSREDAIEFTDKIRAARSDMVFGADFITGFPTETEAMFQKTLDLVDECGLNFLHVFPYSARRGTPAAKMPQILGNIRKERAARLRAKGDEADKKMFEKLGGKTGTILVERSHEARQVSLGHAEDFSPVILEGVYPTGALVQCKLEAKSDELWGIAVNV
ncbi:MAG: tRNA (N(6)-L-threonylcarbamoyladenosine(37)-C(2))-methylthiotransferase MtaB [Sphingomonadales bacterium]